MSPSHLRHHLAGHLSLATRLGFRGSLDDRLRLLAAQIAAEASGCRWCIERGRHDWRRAGLPPILLRRLDDLATSPLLDPRERAACRFALAAVRGEDGFALEIAEARRYFSEFDIAELARCLADHHCLDDPSA